MTTISKRVQWNSCYAVLALSLLACDGSCWMSAPPQVIQHAAEFVVGTSAAAASTLLLLLYQPQLPPDSITEYLPSPGVPQVALVKTESPYSSPHSLLATNVGDGGPSVLENREVLKSLGASEQEIVKSLKPATEDMPPVAIPPEAMAELKKLQEQETLALVQGRVYLGEDIRATEGQFLVFQVTPATDTSRILAGAKLPLAKIRHFPLDINFYKENLLVSKSEWKAKGRDADLMVKVFLCEETDAWSACVAKKSTRQAQGVAVSVSGLPGMDPSLSLHSPAALRL